MCAYAPFITTQSPLTRRRYRLLTTFGRPLFSTCFSATSGRTRSHRGEVCNAPSRQVCVNPGLYRKRVSIDVLNRRYPLIFGPWREVSRSYRKSYAGLALIHENFEQRYDAEIAASTKIAQSVSDIIHRSPNAAFRNQCRGIVNVTPAALLSLAQC